MPGLPRSNARTRRTTVPCRPITLMARRHLPLLLVPLALGCRTRPSVRAGIAKGSTVQALVFEFRGREGQPPTVRSVRVERVRRPGRAGREGPEYWSLAPAGGRGSAPIAEALRYGRVPAGFRATTAAALAPGLYELDAVDSSGTHAQMWFRVTSDGSVSGPRVPAR